MDGAKPAAAAAGVKQGLEEALLQIVQKHHHQSLRQRQQTGTPPIPPRYFFLIYVRRQAPLPCSISLNPGKNRHVSARFTLDLSLVRCARHILQLHTPKTSVAQIHAQSKIDRFHHASLREIADNLMFVWGYKGHRKICTLVGQITIISTQVNEQINTRDTPFLTHAQRKPRRMP
jgi:hypothetical protein